MQEIEYLKMIRARKILDEKAGTLDSYLTRLFSLRRDTPSKGLGFRHKIAFSPPGFSFETQPGHQ